MTGVSRLDRVRNEVVRARTGVRRELAARVDVNVFIIIIIITFQTANPNWES